MRRIACGCPSGMGRSPVGAIPLGIFMVLCMAAPFIPTCSFFLPVISRGTCSRKAVALTFDDGPDPLTTPELLRLLKKHRVSATFFVTGHRVVRYPQLTKDIIAQGHSLANHSFHHDMLGAFRSTHNDAARNRGHPTCSEGPRHRRLGLQAAHGHHFPAIASGNAKGRYVRRQFQLSGLGWRESTDQKSVTKDLETCARK